MAFAPSAGQFVVYKHRIGGSPYVEKQVIESVRSSATVVASYRIEPNGKEKFVHRLEYPAFVLDDRFISDIRQRCAEVKGLLVQVKVPAGEFTSCKTVYRTSVMHIESWMAQDVPFGVVKYLEYPTYQPERVHALELTNFGVVKP
jgi:hypothetical protein